MGFRFLRWIFDRSRNDEHVAEEMRQHVELRTQALIDEGWPPPAARHEAQRMFGNTAQLREEARDMWGFRTFDDLAHDVRYGVRYLSRSPVFTLVALVSVAVAIGAGAAIFAITNAVAFRPIGVGDGETLYRIFTSGRTGGLYGSSSYVDYLSFADAEDIFSATCAADNVAATIAVGGNAALHSGELVSPDCFKALRLRPAYGRFFDSGSLPQTPSPIVVSHGLWTQRFAADPAAIGQGVVVNGKHATIVGVAPRGFAGTSLDGSAEFWAPIGFADVTMPPRTLEDRHRRFSIYARLRDGIDRPRAEAALAVIASRLRRQDERAWATANGGTRRVTVMRELDARFAQAPDMLSVTLGAGLAAVAFIVGVACVNLATMLLARGAARARELSIRLALGASRARVVRQLATESLLVSFAGGVLGVGLVAVALRVASDYRPPEIPAFDVVIDWRVVLFAVGVAVCASLLFGVAPAAHALKLAIAEGMKAPVTGKRSRRLRVGAREALIVLQVTASLAILLVSTLFVRASLGAGTLHPGFNGQGVVISHVSFEALDEAVVPGLTARLQEAAERVPGVERAALAGLVPMSSSRTHFMAAIEDGQLREYYGNFVSPGYFAMLRIPLLAGRDFDVRDGANTAKVGIVSETFARLAWQTPARAIGRIITFDKQPVTIVGVVGDIRYMSPTEPFQSLLFLPIVQGGTPYRTIVHARVTGDGGTIAELERALRSVDARVAVEPPSSMNAYIDGINAPERMMRWVAAAAGGLQLALALMALWGLVAYAVERRSAEWGLRVALGATPSSLVRLSVRPAAVLIVAGVIAGLGIGAVATQILRSSGMSHVAMDPRAALPLALVFATVALFAAWWPAKKAALVDPASLLRRE